MNIKKLISVLEDSATFCFSVDDEEGCIALMKIAKELETDEIFAHKISQIINRGEKLC